MNPLAIPLPAAVNRRGEIVGLAAGVACFPLALYAGLLENAFPTGPAAVVLPIVMLSALAGAVASAIADPSKAPDVGGVSMRVGARSGFITSLVGGAFSVLAATFHSFDMGAPASVETGRGAAAVLLPTSPTARVIVLALLALPPSIFFGLIGSLLAGMLKNPPPVGDGSQTPAPSRERSVVFSTAIVITIACYLSPLLVVFKSKPKPVTIAIATPRPSTPLPAVPPPPTKWRYRKPETFNSVEPSRIAIAERRELAGISQQQPVAISPDGLRFAYFTREQGRRLKAIDLETLDVIASAETTEEPASLAWSPDSRRLFFATEGERKSLVVFDVESSQLISLPKPIDMRVPTGRPLWWDEDDIFFVAGSANLSVLNLDTLRVVPTDESPRWKALPEVTREVLKGGVLSHLPGNPRWQMRVESAVRRYDVPVRSDGSWTFNGSMNLVLVSPQNAYRVTLSGVDVRLGDDLVASPDGSKVLRIRDGAASIFFLGLREEPANQCNITMPEAPDASVSDALAKNRVCAFVCAPLINPLNRKTVGPDREQVKAIGRFMKWEGTSARFWIAEEYSPVGTGDVVADLHTWEARRPQTAGSLGKSEWFAVIETMDGSARPPARNEASPLDRDLKLQVDTRRGADHIEKVVATQPPPSPPPPQVSEQPTAPAGSDSLPSTVEEFIRQHHAKSSRSDIAGLTRDFAERVEFMSHGIVGHDFIAKDLADYHGASARITDNIVSTPMIESRPDGEFDVTYLVSFRRDMPDRRWFSGIAEFSLRLKASPSGLKITAQHIKLREQRKGP